MLNAAKINSQSEEQRLEHPDGQGVGGQPKSGPDAAKAFGVDGLGVIHNMSRMALRFPNDVRTAGPAPSIFDFPQCPAHSLEFQETGGTSRSCNKF